MRACLLVVVALLSGCAAQVVTVNIPEIERSVPAQITDLRPEKEKQSEIFSLLVTSDAYAIYRIPDSAIVPQATRLFQHRAFEKLGADNGPLDIKVHHFVVYRNLQSELRRGALGAALGGAIGAVLAGQVKTEPSGIVTTLVDAKAFEMPDDAEFKRALYTEQENPGRGSVHVIYIETEIRGKRAFTRTIVPIKSNTEESPLVSALDAATGFHLTQY